jgi:integrase
MMAVQGQRNEHMYHLALTTGMRQGELLGLMWKDIDWVRRTLSVVRQAFIPEGGGYTFVEPKTRNGMRTIELSAVDMDILRLQISKVDLLRSFAGDRWVENDLVFPSTVGTPLPRWGLDKEFKKFIAKQLGSGDPFPRFEAYRRQFDVKSWSPGLHCFSQAWPLHCPDHHGPIWASNARCSEEAADLMGELVRPIRVDQDVE